MSTRIGISTATFLHQNDSRPTSSPSNIFGSKPKLNSVRKEIDPDTSKYFLEISNVLDGEGISLDERASICVNALEETRGKELELATDYIISHTLETLLLGCDADHLCGFLQGCASDFSSIAMDRSGSHVAEIAFKSLAGHLQDKEADSFIEETLRTICKAIITNPVDVMCNCHGSHVLRSLLCLCKGVPLDSTEYHSTKSSTNIAARFSSKVPRVYKNESSHWHQEFPDLLKLFVLEMLKHAKNDIRTLQENQFSSLVLQTALKLLVGYDEELLHIIPVILGLEKDDLAQGSTIVKTKITGLVDLINQASFSRLMEVILEVAPETLYNEIFIKMFRSSLFKISSQHCGNFVIQALVSHANCESQMDLIWEELGAKFEALLGMGRFGVVASVITATQRLHKHEHKCCQALVAAVSLGNEPPKNIVPRILFLDSYFGCEDPSCWNWPSGARIHIMGSLILQSIFKFPSEFIHSYITSIISMKPDNVLQAAKDSSGTRVIEAFLDSNVSEKHKRKLVSRLRGHFGKLAMSLSGSYTVERCFNVGSMSQKEGILSELVSVQTELSKTKQGPYLLRNLDVERFAERPEEWKSRQTSKNNVYQKFHATFGSNVNKLRGYEKVVQGTKKSRGYEKVFQDTSERATQQKKLKEMSKEIDQSLSSSAPQIKLDSSDHKLRRKSSEQHSEKKFKKDVGNEVESKMEIKSNDSVEKTKKKKKSRHN